MNGQASASSYANSGGPDCRAIIAPESNTCDETSVGQSPDAVQQTTNTQEVMTVMTDSLGNPKRQENNTLVPVIASSSSELLPGTRIFSTIGSPSFAAKIDFS
ncbi:unnamed protein product [Dibothriocephalus latus]|uniref:Uncharacterized protein n=1 Tax=Dibothriocephalus latus TaxID=60516 RepID=A0A3P7PA35_DIBLA|nr:unnamed protein product [Dibothriocephalus latus]